jgi:hypothetical protein
MPFTTSSTVAFGRRAEEALPAELAAVGASLAGFPSDFAKAELTANGISVAPRIKAINLRFFIINSIHHVLVGLVTHYYLSQSVNKDRKVNPLHQNLSGNYHKKPLAARDNPPFWGRKFLLFDGVLSNMLGVADGKPKC